jgi:two-component system, OmpR family, phosphate regulon sensor histidine kinase PhoR
LGVDGWAYRALAAALTAAIAMAIAISAGAPAVAALVALLGGLAAYAWLPGGAEPAPAAPEPPADDGEGQPALPAAADVLAGVDEPRLIVRGRRVLLANPAARRMLGEHIEGVDVRLAIRHPAAAERLNESPDEADEPFTRTELAGLGEPGRRWEMTTSRLADGSRLVRLTDRSQAHAAEQMRVNFVANASHELRTPLATILGFLETLEDPQVAGDARTRTRFLKVMQDEAVRMRGLVEDLMSLSRIEADRFSVPRDPVDLVPLVAEVKAALAHVIEEKGAALEIENRAGAAVVAGDRPQLAQMLANLLSNSLKYGRPGAPIKVCFDPAGAEMVRVSVIDEGEGIAPEHLPRLTERFYRVDAGRSRSVGGTGLGLAIVKHIVSRHRGRLDIRSRLGVGTSVRVYLPRAHDAAEPAPGALS